MTVLVYWLVWIETQFQQVQLGVEKQQKKYADRVMNNGWNFKTRSNRYVDDSDTYYYGKKAQDFGLRSNQDFKRKQSDNKSIQSQMSDAEWKEYMNNRISHMQDYLNRHYPKKK